MKNCFLRSMAVAVVLQLVVAQANAQINYAITGKIDGISETMKVHLVILKGKEPVRDSLISRDGNFVFKGKLARPLKAYMYMNPVHDTSNGQGRKYYADFYVGAGETHITAHKPGRALVQGGSEQQVHEAYLATIKPFMDSIARHVYFGKNEDSLENYKKIRTHFIEQAEEATVAFIKAHPDSYVSFDLVAQRAILVENPDQLALALQSLSPVFRQSNEGKKMAHAIAITKRFRVGEPVIDFKQDDSSGNAITYASVKGKYVLIDFWASWCGPCKMEYPYLKKAYQQFKDRNFEIIGISLDSDREKWLKAIRENQFSWLMASDLKGKNNEVALAYGISAIPQSLLVDTNGIIIAKNLRGDDLLKKLEEVIK